MNWRVGLPLRNSCATVLLALGITLVAQLWYQPLAASTLLLAANGFVYLLLALGLYGISRFSLLLSATLLAARAVEGWPPLDETLPPLWETSRMTLEMLIASCCLGLFWVARHRPTP